MIYVTTRPGSKAAPEACGCLPVHPVRIAKLQGSTLPHSEPRLPRPPFHGAAMSVIAYVGLGSNLGDRQTYLDGAIQALQERPDVEVTQVSSYYETDPVGGPPGQGQYLN